MFRGTLSHIGGCGHAKKLNDAFIAVKSDRPASFRPAAVRLQCAALLGWNAKAKARPTVDDAQIDDGSGVNLPGTTDLARKGEAPP